MITFGKHIGRLLGYWEDMGFPGTGPEWDGAQQPSKHAGESAACLKERFILENKGNVFVL